MIKEILLKLTSSCNLACSYCTNYSKFNKDQEFKITLNDIKKIIDPEIKNNKNNKILLFEFFGGEPLIYFPLIKEVLEYYKDTKNISWKMNTNSFLLTDEIFNFLYGYKKEYNNLFIYLSYDGLWSETTRPQQDKKDSNILNSYKWNTYFNRIIPFIPLFNSVHCTISKDILLESAGNTTILQNYFYLNTFKEFNKDLEIEFNLVRDNKHWNEKTIKNIISQLYEFYDFYLKHATNTFFFNSIPKIFKQWVIKMIIFEFKNVRIESCGVGYNKLAYDPKLKLHTCDKFFDSKYTMENQIDLIDMALNNETCNNCSIKNYCSKGCLYQIIENNNTPDENLCLLYKVLYNFARDILFKGFKRDNNFNKASTHLYNEIQLILKNEEIQI